MKVKTLTLTGLERVIQKMKLASCPQEFNYFVELTKGQSYSFTVPNYVNGKSIVEAYINGFRLVPSKQYELSSAGVVKLLFNPETENNSIHIIHRKWS